MKSERLKNAIRKAGLEMSFDGKRYHVKGKGRYYGSFWVQGENAVCVSVCPVGDAPDSMTDYFPQSYHDTIKGFIHSMTKEGF